MKVSASSGVLAPVDFAEIEAEVPELSKFDVVLESYTFSPIIDSSNVVPEDWLKLAQIIEQKYDAYDGFVVLHGTDTMSYTASALSFIFENLAKPVVFTGSQIPIGVLRTDGKENLISAIEIAAAGIVCEVTIFFQNKLLRANRTTKSNSEYFDAFCSPNFPPLAEAGITIKYSDALLGSCNSVGGAPLKVAQRLCTDVVSLRIFPGIERRVVEALFAVDGLRGVVLESYGSGNAPSGGWFVDMVGEVVRGGVVVVNVTQCLSGSVDMGLYETGKGLIDAGVIGGGDMTFEAAITKLNYLLADQTLTVSALRSLVEKSIRGEITI